MLKRAVTKYVLLNFYYYAMCMYATFIFRPKKLGPILPYKHLYTSIKKLSVHKSQVCDFSHVQTPIMMRKQVLRKLQKVIC